MTLSAMKQSAASKEKPFQELCNLIHYHKDGMEGWRDGGSTTTQHASSLKTLQQQNPVGGVNSEERGKNCSSKSGGLLF